MYKTTFIKQQKQQNIYDFLVNSIFNTQSNTEIKYDSTTINTYETEQITENTIHRLTENNYRIGEVIYEMNTFKQLFPNFDNEKEQHYDYFRIPKKKGGYREIYAPKPDLKALQQKILSLFVDKLRMLPHNAAHAYVKNRCTITMAEKHKKANCLIKMDLSNFFDSITSDILRTELLNFEPLVALNEFVNNNWHTENFIEQIINIATKDGHLIQGNPLSPFLSNILMIKFDYLLQNKLGKELPYYTYTRYADDIYLSAEKFCKTKEVINTIDNLIKVCYNNCIKINKEKTKLLKITNRCYITGIKLNKDHQLTFGHEHKKELKLRLYNLFVGYANHTVTQEEVQEVLGVFTYMKQIEPEYADYLQRYFLTRFESRAQTLYKHFKF